MNKNQEIIEENRDTLETLANADCNTSKYAKQLLKSIEGDESDSTKQSRESEHMEHTITSEGTQEPDNTTGIKESVFAY